MSRTKLFSTLLLAVLGTMSTSCLADSTHSSGTGADSSKKANTGTSTDSSTKANSVTGSDDSAPWMQTLEKAERAAIEGDSVSAESIGKEALALAPDDVSRATILNQIGVIRMKLRHYKDAQEIFEKALALRIKVLPPNKIETLQARTNYALASYKLGDEVKAEKMYRENIGIKRVAFPNSATLVTSLVNLGHLLTDTGRFEEAKKCYLEANKIDISLCGEKNIEVARDFLSLGASQLKAKQYAEAIEYLNKSNQTFLSIDDKSGSLKCLHWLALVYEEQKNYDKALEYAKQALTLHESLISPDHPDTQIHLITVIKVLRASGKLTEAEEMMKRVLAMVKANSTPSNVSLTEYGLELGLLYVDQKKTTEADLAFKDAITHYELLSKKDKRMLYELPLAYSKLLKSLKRDKESDIIANKYLDVYAPDKP